MLEKKTVIDKIEILEDGTIQTRESTVIFEDGVEISRKHTNRKVIDPDMDITKEEKQIQDIANIVRTPEKVAAFIAKKEKLRGAEINATTN